MRSTTAALPCLQPSASSLPSCTLARMPSSSLASEHRRVPSYRLTVQQQFSIVFCGSCDFQPPAQCLSGWLSAVLDHQEFVVARSASGIHAAT